MTETVPERVSRSFLASSDARSPAARLGVAVVHDLVNAIVTGEVATGESLPPEGPLSAHFGVSRTVIRESVKRIEEKGLVTVVQGRGTQVQPYAAWNMLDPVVLSALVENDSHLGVLDELTTVRSALEGSMSAEVAARRSDEDVERLGKALAHMAATIDDEDAYNQADFDFHSLVMALSGNRLAENITRILFERARTSQRFTGSPTGEMFRETLNEHSRILDAIAAGEPAAAELAMRSHIMVAWQRRRPPNPKRA